MKAHIFCLTIITSMFTACDVDQMEEHLSSPGHENDELDVQLQDNEDTGAWGHDLPESPQLNFSQGAPQVQGPPGTTCCANCGDNWDGWHDLGTADNCNGRAWNFCSSHGWTLINAEWFYHC